MLKTQMQVLQNTENEANPFSLISVTDSDVEEAANEVFILDNDNDIEDEFLDVEEI